MGDKDAGRPDGLLDARLRRRPGEGIAEDDVTGHGMPEIPGAGDGFAAAPRLPRRDGLAADEGEDVEGHVFMSRSVGEPSDDDARSSAATDEASPA